VLNGEQPLLLLSDLQKFIGSLGTGSTVRSEKISALIHEGMCHFLGEMHEEEEEEEEEEDLPPPEDDVQEPTMSDALDMLANIRLGGFFGYLVPKRALTPLLR